MNAEFAHDIGAMHAHCVVTEIELARNFFVRFSVYDQLQDLKLPRSQFAVSPAYCLGRLGYLWSEQKFTRGNLLDRLRRVDC